MKSVLITGGTGSFGRGFASLLLDSGYHVRVFSRCEHKQREMALKLPWARYYIGDIRDKDRLVRAMDGVDYVVHAAALKQSPLGEIEVDEFVKTNVAGSINVADAAIQAGVSKCLLISSDKAVEPINLYGNTKMTAERLFLTRDRMRGTTKTRFAFTRYGNVAGTAGSVVPFYLSLPKGTRTPLTDPNSTRFWITLKDANKFVLESLEKMEGGEVFIPSMKSVYIRDLARLLRPGEDVNIIGLRPGDKLHETITLEPNKITSEINVFMTDAEILRDCGVLCAA